MGFKVESVDQSKASIQATDSGEDLTELLECLKNCMARRITNIEIHLAPETPDTPPLIELLSKTSLFLKSKNGSFVLKNIPSSWSQESLSKLDLQAPPTSGAPAEEKKSQDLESEKGAQSSLDLLPQVQKIYAAFEKDKTLPEKPQLEAVIPWMLEQIKVLYTQEEYLQSESTFFEQHLKSLKKGYNPDPKIEAQITSLSEFEKNIINEQQKLSQLRDGLSKLKTQLQERSTELQNSFKKTEVDSRKKKDLLEKQLKELKSSLQKLEQDFQKKSEQRQKEIQKLSGEKKS